MHNDQCFSWFDLFLNYFLSTFQITILFLELCQITSFTGSSANGVITTAKGMSLACNRSLLQGILYIVLLMNLGLQLPREIQNWNKISEVFSRNRTQFDKVDTPYIMITLQFCICTPLATVGH